MPDIYNQTKLEDVLLIIFAIIVIIILFWCLYSFIRAIFFFIFSGWKDEQKKKWRNAIRFMVVGIIISLVLLIWFPYVIRAINPDVSEDYTTKKVFSTAGNLFKKAFELWDIIKDAQKENEFRGNPYYEINNSGPDLYNL